MNINPVIHNETFHHARFGHNSVSQCMKKNSDLIKHHKIAASDRGKAECNDTQETCGITFKGRDTLAGAATLTVFSPLLTGVYSP